jgi:hypothetical protein
LQELAALSLVLGYRVQAWLAELPLSFVLHPSLGSPHKRRYHARHGMRVCHAISTARWRRFAVLFLRLVLNGSVSVVFYVSIASAQQAPQAGAPASDISNIPKTVGEQLGQSELAVAPAESSSTSAPGSSRRSWAPADIDEAVPPVRSDATCPLPQILKKTSKHT